MFGEFEVRELVDELFEEEALVIGGLVAAYGIDDDLVTSLMGNLEAIRGNMITRIESRDDSAEARPKRSSVEPHPAIKEFLIKLRR